MCRFRGTTLWLFVLFWLSLFALNTEGLIQTRRFSDIGPGGVFISSFDFEGEGKMQIKLTNIYVNHIPNDVPRTMGILVKRSMTNYNSFHNDNSEKCLFDTKLEAFEQRILLEPGPTLTYETTVRVDAPGHHAIYFINCEEDTIVSFNAELTFYNLGFNFLPIGHAPLTMVYAMLAPFYIGATWMWFAYVYKESSLTSKTKEELTISKVMVLLFSLETIYTIGKLVEYHYWKYYGFESVFPFLIYNFFCITGRIILLSVLVKILYSHLKVSSILRQKKVLLLLIPLQIILSVALYYFCWNIHPNNFNHTGIIFTIDLICLVLIFVTTERQMKQSGKVLPYDKETKFNKQAYLFHYVYFVFAGVMLVHSLGGLLDRYLYYQISWVGPFIVGFTEFILLGILGLLFYFHFNRKSPTDALSDERGFSSI